MLVKKNELPKIDKQLESVICWMDSKALTSGSKYILQHGVNKVLAKVKVVNHKINPDYSGIVADVNELKMNDIASVDFQLNKPIYADAFKDHRTNGSFILIDTFSNNTVGAGFIQ